MKAMFEEYGSTILACIIGTFCLGMIILLVNSNYNNVVMPSIVVPLQNEQLQAKPAPEITAENRRIRLGEVLDVMEGVTATDGTGQEITEKVLATSKVDTSEKGRYSIYYEVENSFGRKGYKKIYIIVD